jgi:surface protein
MSLMFYQARAFNQDISNWNLHPNVTFETFRTASALTTAFTPLRFR